MEENDPVALKNAYRELFDCVIVGELDKNGKRDLKWVLKYNLSSVTIEDVSCDSTKMAGASPLEPQNHIKKSKRNL
jgi:hypothetical protein